MRELHSDVIIEAVAGMCAHANRILPTDVRIALKDAEAREHSPAGREILRQLKENYELAETSGLPLCQDTGLAVFLVELGQDLHIAGLCLHAAINEGMRKGYLDGLLRKSMCDPFTRKNTGDNSPAVIHVETRPGDALRVKYLAKGGGSENMSRVTMLSPSQGWEGIKEFTLQRVAEAGPNPCPPIILGLGIGGGFDHAPILARKALFRKLDDLNPDPALAAKEAELLEAVNALGIGPMGLGGECTCLAVKMETSPCHIASLPLAVNIQCHSARHEEVVL